MEIAGPPEVRARRDPSGSALAEDATVLDNTAFRDRVRQASDVLSGRGDVVAVVLPDRVDLVVLLFAAWRLGAAVTPVLTSSEIGHQLADSGAVLVVGDTADHPEVTLDAAALVADGPVPGPAGAAPDTPAQPSDIAPVIYTSGTTGRPKGAVLDHANPAAMAAMIVDALGLGATDRSLLVLPLFHCNGIVVGVLSPCSPGAGRRSAAASGPTGSSTGSRPCARRTSPPCPRSTRCSPRCPPRWPRTRPRCAGSSVGPRRCRPSRSCVSSNATACRSWRATGCRKAPAPPPSTRPVACGSPAPPGCRCPAGGSPAWVPAAGFVEDGPGEVVISGPNVMRGYLVLVDRIKDMIIRGAENLYPKEIENALRSHPDVLGSAVVGAPDPVLGEVPVAYVVLYPGSAATVDGLLDRCRGSLARIKLPARIDICDALPGNSVGKIDKPVLRRNRTPAQPETTHDPVFDANAGRDLVRPDQPMRKDRRWGSRQAISRRWIWRRSSTNRSSNARGSWLCTGWSTDSGHRR